MKISTVDKIEDYFREINTEAVFVALKENSVNHLKFYMKVYCTAHSENRVEAASVVAAASARALEHLRDAETQ